MARATSARTAARRRSAAAHPRALVGRDGDPLPVLEARLDGRVEAAQLHDRVERAHRRVHEHECVHRRAVAVVRFDAPQVGGDEVAAGERAGAQRGVHGGDRRLLDAERRRRRGGPASRRAARRRRRGRRRGRRAR
jgi:hypothetical protein